MKQRSVILMAQLLLVLGISSGFLAPTFSAWGQCCLGAQDMVVTSANARYTVEATSLTGTGPMSHGPYNYRFRWTEVDPDGSPLAVTSFDVSFATNEHFSMSIYVSNTGSGFLLDTVLLPHSVFYRPDGTIQQRHVKRDRYFDLIQYRSENDGCVLTLRDPREERGPDAVVTDERDLYFLPLGATVSETLDEQILSILAGEADPDLSLLGCLLAYPNADVVLAASTQLVSVLPPDFDGSRDWINQNETQLHWVEETGQFVYEGN